MFMPSTPFTLTFLAGLSTALGGVIAVLFKPTARLLAACAGFAAGVMLTVSLADLAPLALEFYGQYFTPFQSGLAVAALLLAGCVIAALLGRLLPDETELALRLDAKSDHAGPAHAAALRVALATSLALVAHNLPEGVLTLFAGVADPQLGLRTALAVALHNIPEGLAVAAPFYFADRRRGRAVGAALASGMAEPLGAVLAYGLLRGLFTPGFLNGTMILAAGIMLWVAADTLLPQALDGEHRLAGSVGLSGGCLIMLIGIAALD